MLCNYRAKFNPLNVVYMDKISVTRLFHLEYQKPEADKPGFHYFQMSSSVQGEFGPVELVFIAQIDADDMELHCGCRRSSAEPIDHIFLFREMETKVFLNLLSMFNPNTLLRDGLPWSQTPESA